MPQWTMLWAYCVLAVVLVAAAITDVRSGKIFNMVTYPAIAVGLVGHTIAGGFAGHSLAGGIFGGEKAIGLAGSVVGFAVGFVPLLVAWMAGGVGGGDAKLMGAVGALTGWSFTLSAMVYGLLVVAVMAIFVMIRRRIAMATLGRIWRFLYLSFTPGKRAGPSGPESPTVPFGLALCIGSVAALVELLWKGRLLLDLR